MGPTRAIGRLNVRLWHEADLSIFFCNVRI